MFQFFSHSIIIKKICHNSKKCISMAPRPNNVPPKYHGMPWVMENCKTEHVSDLWLMKLTNAPAAKYSKKQKKNYASIFSNYSTLQGHNHWPRLSAVNSPQSSSNTQNVYSISKKQTPTLRSCYHWFLFRGCDKVTSCFYFNVPCQVKYCQKNGKSSARPSTRQRLKSPNPSVYSIAQIPSLQCCLHSNSFLWDLQDSLNKMDAMTVLKAKTAENSDWTFLTIYMMFVRETVSYQLFPVFSLNGTALLI